MKKLLILMLVLGLASAASAVPMELRVAYNINSEPPPQDDYFDPVDSELILFPSDTLWVGVYNPIDGSTVELQKPVAMALLLVTCPDIKWTGLWAEYVPPLVPGTPPNEYLGDAMDVLGDGTIIADVWLMNLSDGAPDTFNMKGVLDAKELHCEEPSVDNVVYLFNAGTGEIEDMIIIHQIPEPATMALLGLGSLFLLRRRK